MTYNSLKINDLAMIHVEAVGVVLRREGMVLPSRSTEHIPPLDSGSSPLGVSRGCFHVLTECFEFLEARDGNPAIRFVIVVGAVLIKRIEAAHISFRWAW